MEPEDPGDAVFAIDLSAIARTLRPGASVEATLHLVVTAGVQLVGGCDHAGVVVVEGTTMGGVAGSGPLVDQLHRLQVDAGEGPTLEIVRGTGWYHASDDLAVDPTFPRFGPQAADLGIRSALSVRLVTDGVTGALNLYGTRPNAFAIADRARAVILASHGSTALDAARGRVEQAQAHHDDLQAALASRAIIGQAQGILMERERLTAEQAFDVLRRASQGLNVKLRDIAQRLVDTGEDPRSHPTPRSTEADAS